MNSVSSTFSAGLADSASNARTVRVASAILRIALGVM